MPLRTALYASDPLYTRAWGCVRVCILVYACVRIFTRAYQCVLLRTLVCACVSVYAYVRLYTCAFHYIRVRNRDCACVQHCTKITICSIAIQHCTRAYACVHPRTTVYASVPVYTRTLWLYTRAFPYVGVRPVVNACANEFILAYIPVWVCTNVYACGP